jgi:hypothetical protein
MTGEAFLEELVMAFAVACTRILCFAMEGTLCRVAGVDREGILEGEVWESQGSCRMVAEYGDTEFFHVYVDLII